MSAETMTETAVTSPGHSAAQAKKFAAPPVKLACLACRASRTRCDGDNPCAGCRHRARECVYKPSRRGGARVRKKQAPRMDGHGMHALAFPAMPYQEEVPQQRLEIQSYIDPGAGLKQLQDVFTDSDFIFDSLFMADMPQSINGDSTSEASLGANPVVPMVRTYASDQAILDAYYVFLHPYFPILPPPMGVPLDQAIPLMQSGAADGFDTGFEPETPLGLALSAILALIPCATDPSPSAHDSVLFRRKYAQYLAQRAVESIEMQDELPESSTEPPKALGGSPRHAGRLPFHIALPAELECVVALSLLSVYEYSQRGNIKKMQSRAGQALVEAMDQSLHRAHAEDALSEARRRVWWMTYLCVSQAAIVSNTEPSFSAFSPSFTARYPTLQSDNEAFTVLFQAQQAIVEATRFVIELKRALASGDDMLPIYRKMRELENYLEPLASAADTWILQSSTTAPVDSSEEVVSRTLRCIARIKINSARIKCHRYCAFLDVAVFTGKHCDLQSKTEGDGADHDAHKPLSCPCAVPTIGGPTPSPSASNGSISPPTRSPGGSDYTYRAASRVAASPFSSHQSAKICLRAALNIAQSFDDLPYPNAHGQPCLAPCTLGPASATVAPRTMPSFACCAMQCAYALLMVLNKTLQLYPDGAARGPLVDNMIAQLQGGLGSISSTLENYATAFEALGGMRDQIQSVISPSFAFR